MTIPQQLHDLSQQRKEQEQRNRLFTTVRTKLRNTFIGDLAAIEKYLGGWLGLTISESERTLAQAQLCEIWQECRREMLTNGNNQIRAFEKELAGFVVHPTPPT